LVEACSSYTKRLGFPVDPALSLTGAFAQFNISIKSKLIVLNLARLEQAADLHGTRTLLVLCVLGGLLAVLNEELGVVAGKLLERDQEVTEDELELGQVLGAVEEVGDERGDLRSLQVGEGVGEQGGDKVLEEVLVRRARLGGTFCVDGALNLAGQNIRASSMDWYLKPALWSESVSTKKTSWRMVV
jgi:hypothetical protein